jgi:predicted cytidylate kinase
MSDRQSIITITGDLGSGKSTVSSLLAERLNYRKFSTGDLQRNLAREKGMTSLELNKFSENHPEIDQQIDAGVVSLAENDDRIVIDSRLAWHFVPPSFKVYLTVDPLVAASRVFSASRGREEVYATLEEACEKLAQRRASEKRRFKLLYDIDSDDPDNYSVIVDTTYAAADDVAGKIVELYQAWQSSSLTLKAWLNPKRLYPTRTITADEAQPVIRAVSAGGCNTNNPISIVKVGENYFIYDGHKRASAAILSKIVFIPCLIAAVDEEYAVDEVSANKFVADNFSISTVRDWEVIHKFTFPCYPITI